MIHEKTILKPHSSNTADLLKKAIHVASCYGFENMEKIADQQKKYVTLKENETADLKKTAIKKSHKSFNTDMIGDEIIHVLKTAIGSG